MKLSEAINFAVNHEDFNNFLAQSHLNPDDVHQLTARITKVTDKAVEHMIFFDFGKPGASTSDARAIIDFDKTTHEFKFIQIDHPTQ